MSAEAGALRRWSVTEQPDEADLEAISEGVLAHGRALAVGGHARPVACLVKDDAVLVAGGSGRTEFERLFVGYLWVSPPWRGLGLGSQVLARLEAFARERGCRDALIETLSDRTAGLYERLGYQAVARIPGYVGSFTRHVLIKPLGAQPPP